MDTEASEKLEQHQARLSSADQKLHDYLVTEHYTSLIPNGEGKFYGLGPMNFTWGLFVDLDRWGYGWRYCFDTLLEAQSSLAEWQRRGFAGEPQNYIVRKGLGEDVIGKAHPEYDAPWYEGQRGE